MRSLAPVLLLALAACRPDAPPLGGKGAAAPSDTPAAPVAAAPARLDTLAPVGAASALAQAQRQSFDAFLAAFRAAVARRDAAAVRSVLSPVVTSSFGDDATPEAFFRQYPLDDPASEAWADLDRLLDGPAGRDDSLHVFPAAFALDPPESASGALHVVTVRETVLESAQDAPQGTVPAGVWLPLCPESLVEREGDYCVVHPDHGEAWASERDVYAPFGLRLGFRREAGAWRLAFLVAGD